MQSELELQFSRYTRKKYLWIALFVLFGLAAFASAACLFFIINTLTQVLFFVSIIAFVFAATRLIKYEPKKYFSSFGNKEKLLKCMDVGRKYAEEVMAASGNLKKIAEHIVFEEIVHANEYFFTKLSQLYEDMLHGDTHSPLKELIWASKGFYTAHVSGFYYAPDKYIQFINAFEKAYATVSAESNADVQKESVAQFIVFLNDFSVDSARKKTPVQWLGNNWHNITVVIVLSILAISILDVTFEFGLKLDRYLAVGSAVPTIYLLKNYNPFKR